MKRRQYLAVLGALALGLAITPASAAPDFSGTWKLNTDKGANLGMVKAVSENVVITQTKDALVLDYASTFMGSTTKRQVNFDLTGKPVPNTGAMGDKAETVARWDGDKLVVTWTSEGALAGSKTVKTETRALSADGRELTLTTARANKPDMVMVYEKQ